jgi:hypothetical protein
VRRRSHRRHPLSTPTRSGFERQKEVLVVYSTRRDAQIVTIGDRELPRILEKGLTKGVDYYSEFIDEGRFSQAEYQIAFRDFLALKYRGQHFDVVIAMGEKPLEFVATHRDELFAGTPLVYFSDLGLIACRTTRTPRASSPRRISPAPSRLPPRCNPTPRTSSWSSASAPTPYSSRRGGSFACSSHGSPSPTWPACQPPTSMRDWQKLPAHSIVYYLVVDRDGAGESFHPLEYLSRITTIANAPVYSWVDSAMDRGIVGGSLKDQVAQTEAVGQLALRVLRARTANNIPPVTDDLNVMQVDSRRASTLGDQ